MTMVGRLAIFIAVLSLSALEKLMVPVTMFGRLAIFAILERLPVAPMLHSGMVLELVCRS